MDYDSASWLERAEMFLNDGRVSLGNAQNMFGQASSMANSPIPRQKDVDNILAMSQFMATLANGFMSGASVCLGMHSNGAEIEQAREAAADSGDEKVSDFKT